MKLSPLGLLAGLLASSMGCRYGDYCPPAWGLGRSYPPPKPAQLPITTDGISNPVLTPQMTTVINSQSMQQESLMQDLTSEATSMEVESRSGDRVGGNFSPREQPNLQLNPPRVKVRRDPPTNFYGGPTKRTRLR